MSSDIVIYENDQQQVEVRLDSEQETIWLTQAQMAILLDTSADNISLHLKNIFNEDELEESSTTEEYSVVRQEGKRNVARRIKHYNLPVHVAKVCLLYWGTLM